MYKRQAKDSETYQGEETIVIPENVTQIEDYAFSNCAGLKQIVLCLLYTSSLFLMKKEHIPVRLR